MAIIGNALALGISSDWSARQRTTSDDIPSNFEVLDRVFTVWFLIELIVRLVEGGKQFFLGPNWSWNLFDFIVVGSDVVQTASALIFSDGTVDLSILRMLRIVRVTRAIRVVRLVRFFKELRMMVYSVLRSGTSLLWSLMLFFIIIYIFGIFLMQQVMDYMYVEDSTVRGTELGQRLELRWGSLSQAIYTMYACMSGGLAWAEVADDLITIHWFNAVFLGFFIFFTIFVVQNIITGIFVDTAIQSAQSDRDEVISEQMHSQESELMMLKQAFVDADADESGTISAEEFDDHLKDPRVRAHLASVGLAVHEALGLFRLLDVDHSGAIAIEEFVVGCMRLKGGAKSIDLATLMYENKRMVERSKNFENFTRDSFRLLFDIQAELKAGIHSNTEAAKEIGIGGICVRASSRLQASAGGGGQQVLL